jgi:hypothetical protein
VVDVPKVIRNAVAHHALSLRIISEPSWPVYVFLELNAIFLSLFDVYLFRAVVVTDSLVVASVQWVAALKWTVFGRTLLDRFFFRELLCVTKGDKVRVKSSVLSDAGSVRLVFVQNFVVQSRILLFEQILFSLVGILHITDCVEACKGLARLSIVEA